MREEQSYSDDNTDDMDQSGSNQPILDDHDGEDYITDAELLARGIKERASIDPETGGSQKWRRKGAEIAVNNELR